ncbi:alpha-1,3/1,6-mannosyltransferase ALG2 [Coccinella septempunctata]|uniref:alpha-1,3/1,6-mannosyltransferase ALG2 n=1 Tax=Coccinella septempunctata TaxID=41139 RepID=UPI001D07CEBC|nr:alpha-1,3/1,6-mannosyltransferase ALG2 [Coccinella septempunctata]
MTNGKRPKVAFIHPDLGIGGAERLVLDMANALCDEYEIMFLVNHFDPNHCFDELKDERYEINTFGDWIPRDIFGRCRALCAYIKMIYLVMVLLLFYRKQYGIDFFIVDLIPIAVPFLKLFNQKVFYYCHHPDLLATTRENLLKKFYRKPIDWMEYKATKSSDITLVNSEYTASVFKETFPDIDKQVKVLYPTISSSVVKLLKSSDSTIIQEKILDVPKDSIIFMSINRFHPAKKLELAIEAMSRLRVMVEDSLWRKIYLVMIGGYDTKSDINMKYFDELLNLTENLKLKDNIIFFKSPSESKKVQLLLRCSCLIYTPTNEHFGIVPLEAMMARKPVIACNSGGPRETISHGQNGYLCEPNPENLAEYMFKIMNDNNFDEMGQKGSLRLANSFSNELFSKKLKTIISDALKNGTS